MLNFTPLLGAQSDSPAVQSLLEFDGGVKILIDVGWDSSFDPDKLKELERQVPTISIILLTHPTLSHLGAYAHCCKHIPSFSRIPVYATLPVISFGRTLLQDVYASTPLAASTLPASALSESTYPLSAQSGEPSPNILLPPPSTDDIASYFSIINALKYSQPHQPLPSPNSPPLDGLTITAYSAGHTLGGTIWHLQHGSESVVYAVDWNQARENILSGAAWLDGSAATGSEVIEQLRQPTALICSAKRSDSDGPKGGWKHRDESLLNHIKAASSQGGTVLIPCDSSARVLELAFLLERAWSDEASLRATKLFMASRTSGTTMRFARSMLEWMDEAVVREFETKAQQKTGQSNTNNQGQPFDFKHLRLIERKSQVERALAGEGPKVILASDESLSWGFSKDIFEAIASDPRNLVVIVDKTGAVAQSSVKPLAQLGDSVLGAISSASEGDSAVGLDQTLSLPKLDVSNLGPDELPVYQQYLARQRQRHNAASTGQETTLETAADAIDDAASASSSSSEESDNAQQGKALTTAATLNHAKHKYGVTDEDLGVNILLRRKNVHDYDVRGKRGREKMFPFVAKRRRNDEFGDLIRPEEYLRAEERDDTDAQDNRQVPGKDYASLGQKRRLDGQGASRNEDPRRSGAQQHSNKRQRTNQGDFNGKPTIGTGDAVQNDDNDEVSDDESDYEPAEPTSSGPQKFSFTTDTIHVQLKVVSVDYSGLHDKRTLQMLIPLIKPRKLILTAGTAAQTLSLKEDCELLLGSSTEQNQGEGGGHIVFAPAIGAMVDASVDTNAWTIKLSRSLVKQLQWQTFRNLGIVTINGQLEPAEAEQADGDEASSKRPKLEDDEEGKEELKESSKTDKTIPPVLNALPAGLAAATRSLAQSLHVGDLRLAELRKIMQAQGHAAEFKGEGTLLVDGSIAVRKTGIGQIEVESGGPRASAAMRASSFSRVKQKIYEGLAVVAAR